MKHIWSSFSEDVLPMLSSLKPILKRLHWLPIDYRIEYISLQNTSDWIPSISEISGRRIDTKQNFMIIG